MTNRDESKQLSSLLVSGIITFSNDQDFML